MVKRSALKQTNQFSQSTKHAAAHLPTANSVSFVASVCFIGKPDTAWPYIDASPVVRPSVRVRLSHVWPASVRRSIMHASVVQGGGGGGRRNKWSWELRKNSSSWAAAASCRHAAHSDSPTALLTPCHAAAAAEYIRTYAIYVESKRTADRPAETRWRGEEVVGKYRTDSQKLREIHCVTAPAFHGISPAHKPRLRLNPARMWTS